MLRKALISSDSTGRAGADVCKWFVYSAGCILALTAAAKIVSALGSARVLNAEEPVLGLSYRNVMLLAGAVELVVAAICFFSKSIDLRLSLVGWLGISFVGYRAGLWFLGAQEPCRCLGTLTDALHLSPRTADSIMKVLLTYMLSGSCVFMFRRLLLAPHNSKVRFVRYASITSVVVATVFVCIIYFVRPEVENAPPGAIGRKSPIPTAAASSKKTTASQQTGRNTSLDTASPEPGSNSEVRLPEQENSTSNIDSYQDLADAERKAGLAPLSISEAELREMIGRKFRVSESTNKGRSDIAASVETYYFSMKERETPVFLDSLSPVHRLFWTSLTNQNDGPRVADELARPMATVSEVGISSITPLPDGEYQVDITFILTNGSQMSEVLALLHMPDGWKIAGAIGRLHRRHYPGHLRSYGNLKQR